MVKDLCRRWGSSFPSGVLKGVRCRICISTLTSTSATVFAGSLFFLHCKHFCKLCLCASALEQSSKFHNHFCKLARFCLNVEMTTSAIFLRELPRLSGGGWVYQHFRIPLPAVIGERCQQCPLPAVSVGGWGGPASPSAS